MHFLNLLKQHLSSGRQFGGKSSVEMYRWPFADADADAAVVAMVVMVVMVVMVMLMVMVVVVVVVMAVKMIKSFCADKFFLPVAAVLSSIAGTEG